MHRRKCFVTGGISSTGAVMLLAGMAVFAGVSSAAAQESSASERLPGTAPLAADTPLIDRMLEGASRFLDNQLAAAREERVPRWSQMMQAPAAERDEHLGELRERLQKIVGADDPRVAAALPQVIAPLGGPDALARGSNLRVEAIRWPVLEGYAAEGIAVSDARDSPRATIILLPDADTRPEVLVGLVESKEPAAGLPLQLAATGCRVIIPRPISRQSEARGGRAVLTDREYVYRTTFVLGRHPLGLEVQAVRALVDGLRSAGEDGGPADAPIAVAGYGEGGLVALLSGAIDTRIDAVLASGVWGNRDETWREPVSRNLFGLVSEFGDAPLACMIGPRKLIIEASEGPEFEVTGKSAAPGRLATPTAEEVQEAAAATREIMGDPCSWLQLVEPADAAFGSPEACAALLDAVGPLNKPLPSRPLVLATEVRNISRVPDAEAAREHQLDQIEAITEHWVRTSRDGRRDMVASLDTDSLEAYRESSEPQRERLETELIGRFDLPLLPPQVRSRLWRKTDQWTGWEVEMDVFPELITGGILLVPNDATADSPRPVVVCVHGLEGTPLDTIEEDHRAYRAFATRLCERGFIVFCPQQLYKGFDRFRVLQRKANPLGKTLFSMIIPSHRQMVRWLQKLPEVDPERIAFYGLSYGGKSAMRIPAVVTEYGPTICSGDYNEWVLKNVSTRDRFSYVWTGEYEIYEFNLAGTFSYAEMAAMICPRPFMVERGHFDGVAEDRWVAFEYAPVRFLYAARLGIPQRTEIEWFVGPHAINGQKSFDFLHRHLDWPAPEEP